MEKGHYSKEDVEFMLKTNQTRSASRLQELINFIKLSGYKKIGLANCFSVDAAALKLKTLLESEGIEVLSVNCKESKLEASELSSEMKGLSCDPKSQAEYLNNCQTDFNIDFGLCLGHGLLFQKYSSAPVTTMLVKDPKNKHNIMENFA
ncbi:MAG: DUF1847 domain-containing protein [Alphaproteobacteria bacterium]|nr:DUF1847 domain-containing protein [Alphaproteobacteria bacterium]